MIDTTDKTFDLLLQDMLDRIDPSLNKREGSLIRTSLAAAAWAIEGLYLNLAYVQNQAYGTSATGEYLDYKAAECGLSRKQATPAVRFARFNMAPPVGSRFSVKDTDASVYYYLSEACTNSPDTDYADTPYLGKVTCETAGNIGNVYSGSLASVSYITGLTSAILLGTAVPGTDQETDDSLRDRWRNAVGAINFGGNITAYRNFLLAQDGVGAVQVYPVWNGAGTVLCSVVDSDFAPITATKIAELQELLCPPEGSGTSPSNKGYGMAPIGAVATVTTAQLYNIAISASVRIAANSGKTLQEVQDEATVLITKYIKQMCQTWGQMGSWNIASYSTTIYINKIIGILNNIDGVEVASNVLINNSSSDVTITQTAALNGQYVPNLTGVTINALV